MDRLVSSDETGKRTPSPLGGFLVLSFGIFPFNFFLGGFDFFGSKIFWVFWVVVDFGRLEVWVKDLVMNIQVLTNQIWNKKINSFFFKQKIFRILAAKLMLWVFPPTNPVFSKTVGVFPTIFFCGVQNLSKGTSSRAWLLGGIQWRHHQGDGGSELTLDLGGFRK